MLRDQTSGDESRISFGWFYIGLPLPLPIPPGIPPPIWSAPCPDLAGIGQGLVTTLMADQLVKVQGFERGFNVRPGVLHSLIHTEQEASGL